MPRTADTASRSLRPQGRKTMAGLLDAGMEVLADKGYHAARVDDIVDTAGVSHGTFYLYFANKEELFRALATRCADDMAALAGTLGQVDATAAGRATVRAWLADFVALYRSYGSVIRAWSENQVSDRSLARLGRDSFGRISSMLVERIEASGGAGGRDAQLAAAAMLAMVERFTYVVTSRDLGWSDDLIVDNLAAIVHRGFFSGSSGARRA